MRLPVLGSGPVIAAQMCRGSVREADLHGEALRGFRTEPDTGHGRLYRYCRDCVHLEGIPPKEGDPAAPGQSMVYGCNIGDNAAVLEYSQDVASGRIDPDAGLKKCDGFMERDSSTDVDETNTVREARRVRRVDVTTADMIKEVPGEVSFLDDPLADDPSIEPVADESLEGFDPEFNTDRPDPKLDSTRYIWRTQHDERTRFSHRLRDGRIFEWDDPPFDGHAGEGKNCRCWSEGIILAKRCPVCGRGPSAPDDDAILAGLFG